MELEIGRLNAVIEMKGESEKNKGVQSEQYNEA